MGGGNGIAEKLGRGCDCHEEDRLAKKKVHCDKAGRRLPQAMRRITQTSNVLAEKARTLLLADCEGDQEIFFELSSVLRLSGP
jgi:hypothetical protein